MAEPKLSFDTNEFYLKDTAEMVEAFSAWPEAVPTSVEIAERCHVEMELGKMLIPRFETPDGEPEADYLRRAGPRRGCASATATRCPPRPWSGSSWSCR